MFVFGPLLWLVAILVVALFVARGRVVEIALACMLLAFVGGVALSLTGRQLRLREERKVEDA